MNIVLNDGYDMEEQMTKFFRGKTSLYDAVDFETKKTYYEVKSCNLFNRCRNGNSKRKTNKTPQKDIMTTQLGRFRIRNYNHEILKELSITNNKIPKYLFVVHYGKQVIFKTVPWEKVLINKNNDYTTIRIKDVFGDLV